MGRAQLRGASRSRKFYFRKDVLPPGYTSPVASTAPSSGDSSPVENGCCKGRGKEAKMRNCFPSLPRPLNGVRRGPVEDEYEEMTMEEIICGKVRKKNHASLYADFLLLFKADTFPGLLGLINDYVHTLQVNEKDRKQINRYLDLVRRRANGSLIHSFIYFTSQLTSLKVPYKLPQHGYETSYEPTPRTNLIRSLAKRSIMI